MSTEISTALSLMVIGMITVFIVLALVVLCGNVLIRFVNRLSKTGEDIEPKKVAAIMSAVDAFTSGKARVSKIEKIQ